ncbi:unnamed protein product, partial [marine sediment metagenome]
SRGAGMKILGGGFFFHDVYVELPLLWLSYQGKWGLSVGLCKDQSLGKEDVGFSHLWFEDMVLGSEMVATGFSNEYGALEQPTVLKTQEIIKGNPEEEPFYLKYQLFLLKVLRQLPPENLDQTEEISENRSADQVPAE